MTTRSQRPQGFEWHVKGRQEGVGTSSCGLSCCTGNRSLLKGKEECLRGSAGEDFVCGGQGSLEPPKIGGGCMEKRLL